MSQASKITRVTAYDVAAVSGVSQPTVSRILGGQAEKYREQTRRRVLEAAQKLGYRPSAAARITRTGQVGAVALLLGTKDGRSSLPQGLLNGIQDSLHEHDLNLMVVKLSDAHLTDPQYVPRILREVSSDGLLVDYTHDIPEPLLALVRQHAIPAVWINSRQEHNCVRPDDVAAGRLAAEHLINLGHRRIAWADFTHGPDFPSPHYSAADRRQGYAAAMIDAGLQPLILRAQTGIDVPSPRRLAFAADVLASSDRPTAVIGYAQTTTMPFHLAAAQRGLSVPDDLSLVSFDDHPMACLGPRYTTLIPPHEAVGRAAVDCLLKRINTHRDQPPLAVPFGFDPGETSKEPVNV